MEKPQVVDVNHLDDPVDLLISSYLTIEKPKSFFLFAGAGSGKTRSLVNALEDRCKKIGGHLRLNSQRIGVITYTNAACDEIKQRLHFSPLLEVSTIHSFVWLLIGGFNTDIKMWLAAKLKSDIAELEELQSRGRAGKATLDRAKSIEVKNKRLENLPRIKRFTYNPNGDNIGQDSLNHSEVIEIGAYFLMQKPLMQAMLVNKFPILLIDESQDTIKPLMDSFLHVQQKHADKFTLGLFGDTMQRIYGHGKEDLGKDLPADWARPAKQMNHRCPIRVIKLINKVRSVVDDQQQKPRSDKEEGFVRLFILPSDTPDKQNAENEVARQMATITGDPLWSTPRPEVKTLALEHHMAASRMGFTEMFKPLYEVSSLKTGLLDGSLPGLRLFTQQLLPLVKAKQNNNDFLATAIVRKFSPLVAKGALKAIKEDQLPQLEKARKAVESLLSLWSAGKKPRFLDVLRNITQTGLFEIPESLRPIAARTKSEQETAEKSDLTATKESEPNAILDAWDMFLLTPFEQIELYHNYISGQAPFGTHQGVKGLEFPRVMVIMDDNEARGFMFSFDKLLGVQGKTATDIKNEQEGKDTAIARTRRLFYVTCSRAEKSLAIVMYSNAPEIVHKNVVSEGWFEDNEIITLK